MNDYTIADLPLKLMTSTKWAVQVLDDPLALLNDHAHLEKKAAKHLNIKLLLKKLENLTLKI